MPQNQVQPTIFFLKMSCTKSGKWSLLYYSSFLCVLHFNVVFLLYLSSTNIFDVFPSVLVCNPDLFFSQSIYEFRIAVYYCCLYLIQIPKKRFAWFNVQHPTSFHRQFSMYANMCALDIHKCMFFVHL